MVKTTTVLTESGRLSILEDHQINVLFITQAQTGKHFERATGDTTLIGTRVLEKNHALLLKPQPRLLGEKQVGTLDNVLEVRLALRVDELVDIGNVDGFGSTTAGNEKVGLDAEVEGISERGTVGDNLAGYRSSVSFPNTDDKMLLTRQSIIFIINQNLVTALTQLGRVESADRGPRPGQPDQLGPVQTSRVVQNATTINDRHSLVLAHQDFVGTEITIGTASLELGNILLVETVGLEDTDNVLTDRRRSHPISVVRDTTKFLSRLASGERLPPRSVSGTSMLSRPVHKVGSVLIGAKEENLRVGAVADIDNLTLDTRGLAGDEKVDDGL